MDDYFDYGLGSSDGDFDIEELLEQSRESELERLESLLEDIDDELEDRRRVHEELVGELESKIEWYVKRLEDLYKQSFGKTEQKEKLKNRIESFYSELRLVQRDHWRDRQDLRKERRELLRELQELEDDLFKDLF